MDTTTSLKGRSLIGSGDAATGSETFHGINPATGENLQPAYHGATAAEVKAAADLAGEAFVTYRKTSGTERANLLRRIAEKLEELAAAITERMTQETALPEARAKGELARTTGQLRMFANLVEEGSWVNARIDKGEPARAPLPKPDTRFMLQALGPVAVFGPANFPLAFSVAGGDTASALAAGCPVIVKAHSSHPGTSELVGHAVRSAVRESNLPPGVFSLLFGSGSTIGPALVTHPAIKAVGFTGSKKAGRALFDLAAARPEPIPVFAEMSSINPVFILPGALLERGEEIARNLSASVTLGVGQFCTNPGLVLLEQGEKTDSFASALAGAISQTPQGVMLNRGTRKSYCEGLTTMRRLSAVQTLVAGENEPGPGAASAAAAVFKTSAAQFLTTPEMGEELFGPATLLLTTSSREELLTFARQLEGQLTCTVHGTEEDFREHQELISLLGTKAGRVVFNGFPTGVEVCSSMNHSGPYPATTDARFTSVGTAAIYRFARPVCYQNCPQDSLPAELRDGNPLKIWRLVDNSFSRE